MNDWINIKLSLEKDKHNQLIKVANEMDMNLYTLLRTVIDYCIQEL